MADNAPYLTIVVPIYNEADSVAGVLTQLASLAAENEWEVIAVDDCSTDESWQIIQECAGLHAIRHTRNRGYGAALKTGIRRARGDWVAMMDADGQHDPRELLKLLSDTRSYDLVVGKRGSYRYAPLWRAPGKWFLTRFCSFLVRQHIPDLNSGMRIFRREIALRYLHLLPDGFSFTTTSTLIFFNRGYSVQYTPIDIQPRQGSSQVSLATGFETLLLILRIAALFNPMALFLPASGLLFISGILWGVPYVLKAQGVSVGALLLILVGVLVFFIGLLVDQVASLRKERFE